MPRAEKPATPLEDLAARRAWNGASLAADVLTPDLVAFCQSGVSIALGTTGRDGRPIAGRGLSCQIGPSGTVRVVLRHSGQEAFQAAVAAGAGVAVTFTDPPSHRSIQLKARAAAILPLAAGELPATHAQCAAFADALADVGYSRRFAALFCGFEPSDLVAMVLDPEAAFVQTPGPSAGSALMP